MSVQPKTKMTVDEFLAWAEHRPGRHELIGGDIFAMSPERTRHAETKFAVQTRCLKRSGARACAAECCRTA
jgi:Uma2 family endonuclease